MKKWDNAQAPPKRKLGEQQLKLGMIGIQKGKFRWLGSGA